jgi:hypothetical protein
LRWSGPPECDRQHAVSAQVESIVGRALADVEALDFEVTVSHHPDAWHLELVTDEHGAKGRRSVEGQTCGEVTDAAAVLIAMAIRGAPAQAPAAEENASPAPEEGATPAAPAPEASRKDATLAGAAPAASTKPLGPVFGLAGVVDTAALPKVSPGIAAHAGVQGSSFRFEAEGAAFLASRIELEGGRSAEFNLFSGALLGCVDDSFGALRAGGCAGFELGSLSGEGRGVSNPHLGSALWEAARLELGGLFPLGHDLWLTARAGAAIPFSRPEFVLDGTPVYRPSVLGLRASLGVELAP